MSEVSEKFFKELRTRVKKNHSNTRLHQFLNDIYIAGYRQALLDAAAKVNKLAELENANAEQNNLISFDNDGIEREPNSTVVDGGFGPDTNDGDRGQGSADPAQLG